LKPAGATPRLNVVNAYDPVAAVYDAWQERYGSFAHFVLPCLEAALDDFRGVSSFVDLGCGTGTLLLALAERHPGLRLRGVDASAAMLARAQEKPGAERVEWICAPLEQAQCPPRFAAAGAFFNTVNHLPDADALRRMFACVAAALLPGGRLLFDVNNALGFQHWWGQGTTRYAGEDWVLQIATSFDADTGRAHATLHVERDGRRGGASVQERLFSDDEIAAALAGAGLAVEAREPWRPYSDGVPGATFWVARTR
jgi:SAM-dependent methyltransferase